MVSYPNSAYKIRSSRVFTDACGQIVTQTLIPPIRNMHAGWVTPTFVNHLLWLPSETGEGSILIKCSNIEEADHVFGGIKESEIFFPNHSSHLSLA